MRSGLSAEREAAIRMSIYARSGREENQGVAGRPHPEQGRTRDIVAKKAGFTSNQQMRRAAAIADTRPDLLDKVDRKEMTLTGAFEEVKQSADPQSKTASSKEPPLIEERRVEWNRCFLQPVHGRDAFGNLG